MGRPRGGSAAPRPVGWCVRGARWQRASTYAPQACHWWAYVPWPRSAVGREFRTEPPPRAAHAGAQNSRATAAAEGPDLRTGSWLTIILASLIARAVAGRPRTRYPLPCPEGSHPPVARYSARSLYIARRRERRALSLD